MEIKIRPIKPKTERSRLPSRVDREYPKKLLVVYIVQNALERIREYAASDTSYELGGVLVGRIARASRRWFVEIHDFVPARKGVSRRASFEFTNEAQAQIHDDLTAQFPDKKIVGWFHTHPGYGIFLSSADQFIDEHYFNDKHHIAMVLDPTKDDVDAGVFVWTPEKKRTRVPLYLLD
jgi:proteasome lid subunit RPN8/RPN11